MRTEILYEDADLMVIWKPAGLATQTARAGQPDVVSELKNYLARTASGKGQSYLGVVHRLDQPVEGLLVFAKNKNAAAALTRQLGGGEDADLMNKQYYAVFCGKPPREEGELVDYMYRGTEGKAMVADRVPPDAERSGYQKAVLRYKLLQTVVVSPGEELSLADVCIETGRFHQIRAQMAKAGMPLLGDFKYGSAASIACGQRLEVRTVALCAWRIALAHPVTGKSMRFERKPGTGAFSFFRL